MVMEKGIAQGMKCYPNNSLLHTIAREWYEKILMVKNLVWTSAIAENGVVFELALQCNDVGFHNSIHKEILFLLLLLSQLYNFYFYSFHFYLPSNLLLETNSSLWSNPSTNGKYQQVC